MATETFTLDDVRRILREGAGSDESVDLDGDILDQGLAALGYDSLALMETASLIEREYQVALGEEVLDIEVVTPRVLIDAVNAGLDG
ncbi:phosphopantetheine-binding protein [Streptomyces sp. DSM 44915]|uniref:Phosphopantetheine-binding protein n=1 Tax=Streptomyces chisholmiae TaxID=3075540 RepID=A0ABU2JN17_9ACTN|nr:phosphopantetheine-binding protein [Streptomyces sp. DSM 44915]MDT0266136.1 phosphopantetheine-binding protein [Streptomyces sp. DSM 44915]